MPIGRSSRTRRDHPPAGTARPVPSRSGAVNAGCASVLSPDARRLETLLSCYGDRQIADRSCDGGVGHVGFLEVAADERGLASAATEV